MIWVTTLDQKALPIDDPKYAATLAAAIPPPGSDRQLAVIFGREADGVSLRILCEVWLLATLGYHHAQKHVCMPMPTIAGFRRNDPGRRS